MLSHHLSTEPATHASAHRLTGVVLCAGGVHRGEGGAGGQGETQAGRP